MVPGPLFESGTKQEHNSTSHATYFYQIIVIILILCDELVTFHDRSGVI